MGMCFSPFNPASRTRPNAPVRAALPPKFLLMPFLLACLWTHVPVTARALPPGRAWTPLEILNVNGHQNTFPDHFESTRTGHLRLVGRGTSGPGSFLIGFEWGDSAWKVRWVNRHDTCLLFMETAPPESEL